MSDLFPRKCCVLLVVFLLLEVWIPWAVEAERDGATFRAVIYAFAAHVWWWPARVARLCGCDCKSGSGAQMSVAISWRDVALADVVDERKIQDRCVWSSACYDARSSVFPETHVWSVTPRDYSRLLMSTTGHSLPVPGIERTIPDDGRWSCMTAVQTSAIKHCGSLARK